MKKQIIHKIIKEEIENVKWGKQPLKEAIEPADIQMIRQIIRTEVAAIFFELFKKRTTWGA